MSEKNVAQEVAKLIDMFVSHLINANIGKAKDIIYAIKNHGLNITEVMVKNSVRRLLKEKTIIMREDKLLELNNGVDINSLKGLKEIENLLHDLLKKRPIYNKKGGDTKIKNEHKIDPGVDMKELSSRVFIDDNTIPTKTKSPFIDEAPAKTKSPFIDEASIKTKVPLVGKYYSSILEIEKNGNKICIKTNNLIEVMTNIDGDIKIIVSPEDLPE